MFPIKTELDWISSSNGTIYPCEKEFYETLGSKGKDFTLLFCHSFSDDSDSEFARFLTRVAQKVGLPEVIRSQVNSAILAAQRLLAVVSDLKDQGANLELIEQLTDIYGIADIDEELEEHFTGENPRVIRFVLMHSMKSEEYAEIARNNNQKRSEELKSKQQ